MIWKFNKFHKVMEYFQTAGIQYLEVCIPVACFTICRVLGEVTSDVLQSLHFSICFIWGNILWFKINEL